MQRTSLISDGENMLKPWCSQHETSQQRARLGRQDLEREVDRFMELVNEPEDTLRCGLWSPFGRHGTDKPVWRLKMVSFGLIKSSNALFGGDAYLLECMNRYIYIYMYIHIDIMYCMI